MSTLHIVSSSPFETNALQSALKFALSGDAILLIENGVYAASDVLQSALLKGGAARGLMTYVLDEDAKARALPALGQDINTVSYSGFVNLVCQHQNSVSWN